MIDYIAILRRVARDDMALPDNMEWHELFNGAADEIERLRKENKYLVHTDEDIKVQNKEIERLRTVLSETLEGYIGTQYYEPDIVARAKAALGQSDRVIFESGRTELPHVKDS